LTVSSAATGAQTLTPEWPDDGRWRWAIAVVVTTAAALYAFWPIATLARGWNDFSFVYAAGQTWLSGFSPYDFDRWRAEWDRVRPIMDIAQPMPYVYPPHWAPIAVALALLPWRAASHAWDAINVLAYVGVCAFSLKIYGGSTRALLAKPAVWICLGLATMNVAVRQSVFQGQLTIVALLGIAGAFWAWSERRTVWLAVFVFIASLKPQLGLLAIIYLLLNGGHVGVLVAGVAAGILGFLSMLPSGIERLPADLSHVMALHTQLDFNQPSQFFSLPALAAGYLSAQAFMLAGPLIAVAAVLVMTAMRREGLAPGILGDPLWQFGIVAVLTGALMPVHAYDLVVYAPLGLIAYRIRASWTSPAIFALLLLAGRSHVFARHLDVGPPAPLVTGAIALAVVGAAVVSQRRAADRLTTSLM
jgi:hypothetical protein